MISDNYVTGDNIYLRELQNFFFEVLGMMSITHYGAIGDGRRDNYGPLQVAIDDANRRGLSFLYVPYGRFIYTGELTNLIDEETGKQKITFMGNPHAHIVNIRTGEEIEIHQFGWQGEIELENYYTKEEIMQILDGNYEALINSGEYIDTSGEEGDIADLTPITGENRAYFIDTFSKYDKYEIVGDFTLLSLDKDTKEITYKYTAVSPTYDDATVFSAGSDGILVVSFQNTNTITPQIFHSLNIPEENNRYIEQQRITAVGATQFINTRLVPVQGYKIEMKVSFQGSKTTQQSLFGCHYGSPNLSFGCTGLGSGKTWFAVINGHEYFSSAEPESNTEYVLEFYFGGTSQYLKVNGETVISASEEISQSGSGQLYLLTRSDITGYTALFNQCSYVRFYYAKVYDYSDELIRDFVPVIRSRDGRVCIYDKVNKYFHDNIGIGDFVVPS